MTYIYYANEYSKEGEVLNQMLQSAFRKSKMKRCRNIEELNKRLHEPVYDVRAVVLLIEDSIELDEIIALKDVLWDIKLITILSSQANISQKELLTLRPRFITWTDADYSHVIEVLGNMMKCKPEMKVATEALLNQIAQKN